MNERTNDGCHVFVTVSVPWLPLKVDHDAGTMSQFYVIVPIVGDLDIQLDFPEGSYGGN